jgi:P2-related tail formation protein
MRARAFPIAVATAALWAAAGGGSADAAAPLPPVELRVTGGSEAWHPDPAFQVRWANPTTGSPPTSVHYRLRGELGTLSEEEIPGAITYIFGQVPRPGTFPIEVWLENAGGEEGVAAKTTLRYDDVRPPDIYPPQLPRWIGRDGLPFTVHLGALRGSPPLSGIRGYAAKIGPAPDDAPCAAGDRCTDAETTLRQGATGNALLVPSLPEGTSYLSAVAVSGSGMKSTSAAHAVFHVDLTDPVTRLAGAPQGWVSHPVRPTATATDAASGMNGGFTAIRVDAGAPAIEWGSSASVAVIAEGTHTVAYYARDSAGNTDDGGAGNPAPRTATVRIDRTPPIVAFANSQDPRDPELLRASVDDRLSGADPSRGWIGVRPLGSGAAFRRLPHLPGASGELRARWDSDSFPPGDDLAGNATTTTRRRNGAALILSNPLKATTSLSADLGGSPEPTVRFGRQIRLAGRLTTGLRTPLAGMPVRVVERFAPGPGPAIRVSTTETDARGNYSLRLAPGPSREVAANFPGSAALGRSASAPLSIGVRSAVRLRASSGVARVGGAPLVFRGAVAPPETIGPEGEAVQLQFRVPGGEWSEFRTVQTDRRGRFRYAYRFSDDDSRGARFQFRAYVPTQKDWPYEPNGSRPVLVRGY